MSKKKITKIPRRVFSKKYSDEHFKEFGLGMTFDLDYYDTVIDSDFDGYHINPITKKEDCLFRFRKSVISTELQEQATETFMKLAKKKSHNRGYASGRVEGSKNVRELVNGQSQSKKSSNSNIAGYYDRPDRIHKKQFKTNVACRKTAFTNNNMKLWEKGIPFIQRCSLIYQELGGDYYIRQKKEYELIHKAMKIPETVFTTVTVNYNWRTACHTDTGDYSQGLGNLIVTGKNFDGCYLGFPQFKVCIKVRPSDFLLMDVHQYHSNTELKLETKDAYRISYVLYLREHMSICQKKKRIDKYDYYY